MIFKFVTKKKITIFKKMKIQAASNDSNQHN